MVRISLSCASTRRQSPPSPSALIAALLPRLVTSATFKPIQQYFNKVNSHLFQVLSKWSFKLQNLQMQISSWLQNYVHFYVVAGHLVPKWNCLLPLARILACINCLNCKARKKPLCLWDRYSVHFFSDSSGVSFLSRVFTCFILFLILISHLSCIFILQSSGFFRIPQVSVHQFFRSFLGSFPPRSAAPLQCCKWNYPRLMLEMLKKMLKMLKMLKSVRTMFYHVLSVFFCKTWPGGSSW